MEIEDLGAVTLSTPSDLDPAVETSIVPRTAAGGEVARLAGRPLGEILVALCHATPEAVSDALDAQRNGETDRIGEILVERELIEAKDVAQALAVQLEMRFIEEIYVDRIPDELIRPLPISFAKLHAILPIEQGDDSVLVVVADPLDTDAIDDLSLLLNARVEPAIALKAQITEAINRAYDRATHLATEAVQGLVAEEELEEDLDAIDLIDEHGGDDAPIIRFVNALLRDAVKSRASDIHIECFERHVGVRFRIDGLLYQKVEAPKHAQSSIVARVKIMSGLNIAEKRLPQDGRIRRRIAGKEIDVRVSTIPATHGERIVMRILDRSSILLSLEDLGFSEDTLKNYFNLISRPHGIILVSGPTGSGKTTTLYASLAKINSPDVNILTVEDPVEYQLPGIGQMQVNTKIDLTFASGLRHFLRQDPDVIMVGEIRDRETAEIAIQASLTGHLVLSTVHTNDAPGAMTRLVDMGVEPFLVSSTLIGVIAQRLVRTLCPKCKTAYEPTTEEMREIGLKPTEGKVFYREAGCHECLNTGYQGRAGIYELLVVNDEIRQLILKNTDAGTIKKAAVRNGMRTLLQDGARKALRGDTSIEEVLRVAKDEEVVVEV
ncbi:MAG: type II secretion system ATPase GspE [Deltaproteobacteria bacterium]|nr:type II secretion system ATPase GspE [Deltaproteobacteria bacterium]